jgi:flagellar motor switch protein FliM
MSAQDTQQPHKTVELYDFRRPTTLAREHARVLETAFESFARQWATQLTAKVRVKSVVTGHAIIMQSYDEYIESLPSTTSMVLFAITGSESKMAIQFPTGTSLTWISRMLGGTSSAIGEDRKYTQIEYKLISSLMSEAVEALTYSLGGVLAADLTLDSIVYNSQFAQAAGTGDLMIVSTFTVQVGETTCEATVAFPSETLLGQLGAANPVASTENARELVLSRLAGTPVTVGLRHIPVSVLPAKVLGLAEGDVIKLPHPEGRPLDLTVEGQPFGTAVAVNVGPRTAAKIISKEN